MRVCLANDSFPPLIDGVSNTVVNYGNIIQSKYGAAVVATPRYPGVKDDYPFEVVRYASLNTVKLVGYRTGYPFAQDAMERLSAFRPDIIHSHCPMASLFLCRELRDITRVPLVFTYHTKFDIDIKRAVKLKFIHEPAIREVINNIKAADDVWVVNRGAGENLKSLGYEGDYIVMPNGVDIDRTPADAALIEAVERDCGLEPGVPVLLFVGRVMWYKGLRIILDGLRQVKDSGQRFRMIFVGNGDDLEDVKKYASDVGLGGDCVFTGAIYDRAMLKAYYSRADLFLLPSVFDNNPLVVKEAAACGTASVLIRDSSSAEGVTHGDNGILIGGNTGAVNSANDSAGENADNGSGNGTNHGANSRGGVDETTKRCADDLARELTALLRNPAEVKRLGERAAETLYVSWDDSIARAVKRYDEVLARCHEKGYVPSRARYDAGIKFIGETYHGIIKAKLLGLGIKSEFEDQLRDARDSYDNAITWLKGKYDMIKDYFDRYQ